MIDLFIGIIIGVVGVYVYDTHIQKRTKYKPLKDSKRVEEYKGKRPLGK